MRRLQYTILVQSLVNPVCDPCQTPLDESVDDPWKAPPPVYIKPLNPCSQSPKRHPSLVTKPWCAQRPCGSRILNSRGKYLLRSLIAETRVFFKNARLAAILFPQIFTIIAGRYHLHVFCFDLKFACEGEPLSH